MTDERIEDAALFERVQYWKEFQGEAKNLFPTESALRCFIRQHEQALVAHGVLLKLPRGNYVDPEAFRAAAINLMRRQPAVPAGTESIGRLLAECSPPTGSSGRRP